MSFLPTDGSPELLLLDKGEPVEFSEDRASEILAAEDLEVVVNLGLGEGEAKYWTCDFSHVSWPFDVLKENKQNTNMIFWGRLIGIRHDQRIGRSFFLLVFGLLQRTLLRCCFVL